jgi:hypothetical protein
MTQSSESINSSSSADIVARGDNWYRGKMSIMALALIIYCGGFFLYDGFIGYPRLNRNIDDLDRQVDLTKDPKKIARLNEEKFKLGNKKNDAAILLQKVIGFVSIPLGLYVLMNALRSSRGKIRLSGQTLQVPGHPPVTFESITSIDQRLWDKKGIAYINYSLSDGKNGQITLDDYKYQRKPIDLIYDRILAYVSPDDEDDEQAPVQGIEKDERI